MDHNLLNKLHEEAQALIIHGDIAQREQCARLMEVARVELYAMHRKMEAYRAVAVEQQRNQREASGLPIDGHEGARVDEEANRRLDEAVMQGGVR